MSEQMNVDDANVAESVLQYMRDDVEGTSNGEAGDSTSVVNNNNDNNDADASVSNNTTGDHSHSSEHASSSAAAAAAADVAFAALKAVGESDQHVNEHENEHDNGDYLQGAAGEGTGYSKKDFKSKNSTSLSSSKKKSGEGKSHGKRSKDSVGGSGSSSSSSSSHKKRKTSSDEKKSKKKSSSAAEVEDSEEAKKRAAVAAFLASAEGDILTHRVAKNGDNGSSVAGVDPELAGLDDEVDANEAIHQYLRTVDETRPEFSKSKKDKKTSKKGKYAQYGGSEEEEEEEGNNQEDNDVTSNLQKYLIDNPEENGDKKLKLDLDQEKEDHEIHKEEERVQNGEGNSGAITTTTTANGSIVSIAPAAGANKKSRKKSVRGKAHDNDEEEEEEEVEQQRDGKKTKKSAAKKTETKPKPIVKKKSVSHHTKSKAFKPEEEEVIDNFIASHCAKNDLKREDFCKRIWSNAGQKDNFWKSLCELFPERSRSSLYKHVRRRYHIFEQRGKWTAEEDASLRQICLEKEGQWSLVGQMLGRMPEDCRDRWRNYLKCGDNKNTAKWTDEEEQNLIVIVNRVVANGFHYYLAKEAFIRKKDFLVQSALLGKVSEKEARDAEAAFEKLNEREKEQDHHIDSIRSTNLKEVINWTLISEVMNGTRSRIQIRYKWKNSLKKLVKKWFEKSNKMDFVKFVRVIKQQLDDGYENEDLLNWFKIYDNYCHDGKDSINEEESKLEIKFTPSSDPEDEKTGGIIIVDSSLPNKEENGKKKVEDEEEESIGRNVEETREKLIHHPNAAVLKGIYDEFKSKLPVEATATNMHEIVSAMESFVEEW